ncbi:unnamed protein product [Closterium sp. NIES-65]|nr:unnamed protein product [Closterium sp. NIES-65]
MSRHRPVPVAPRPFLVALRVVASRPLTVPSLSPSASSPPVPPFASHFRPVASPVASCPLTVASPSPSVSSPPGVEDKEEGSGRSDEEAGIEGANEARTGETGDAKTEPAEAQAETSPVAVSELEAPPRGSRGRDDPYEEGRHTESSGRQELGGPEMSHQAWQAPNSRGKGKEERSRSAERERRLGGGRVGEFRPRDERQEQGEWSGGASHSAGRAAARGERVRGGNSVAEVARSAARGTQQHHTLARPD